MMRVLEKFDKGHTRADFLAVVARFRELGMTLLPTFVPFTPWTTLTGYMRSAGRDRAARICAKTSRPSNSPFAC